MAEAFLLQVQGLRFAYPECTVLQNLSFTSPAGLVLVRGDLIGVKHDSEDVEDESEG